MDELIKDAKSGLLCQQVIAGMPPCHEPGIHLCYHCKRSYCADHMRERRVNFSRFPVMYCTQCDAAIAANRICG